MNGGLNLSRSFGDFNYKKQKSKPYDQQLITCRPDVTEIPRQIGEDEFIIIGCDGIWERFVNDSQPLVTRIANERKTGIDALTILINLFDHIIAK